MYICSQDLLSVSLRECSVIKREFYGNRSVPSNFILDIEYSFITSDVIKILTVFSYSITTFYASHLVENSEIFARVLFS